MLPNFWLGTMIAPCVFSPRAATAMQVSSIPSKESSLSRIPVTNLAVVSLCRFESAKHGFCPPLFVCRYAYIEMLPSHCCNCQQDGQPRQTRLKQCRRCKELLPRQNFCANARAADGLYTQCRACVSDKVRHTPDHW